MRRAVPLFALLIASFLILPAATATDVYRWKDANGTVHFADAPPPNGVPYKIVNLSSGTERDPTPPPAAAASADAKPPAPAPKELEDTPENRALYCKQMDERIALLESDKPLTLGADSTQVMSDEQRATELATSREQRQQYCP